MAVLTGIDPGTYSIKIVQGAMKGPLFRPTRLEELLIEPDGDPEVQILQEIQGTVPSLKLKPGTTRLGITGRDLMVRYTSVPPVPLWRLRMLMDFEVQDMSQASGEALTADYNLLSSADDSDEVVLVSLVKTLFLERRLRALKQGAKIDVHAATPNCVALFNAFLAFGEMEDDEYTFLLDIGDRNIEMAIQRDGELVFARNLSGGGAMFTDAIAEAWDVSVGKARQLKHDLGNVTPRGRASYESANEEKVANAIMGVAGQLTGMVQSTIGFARAQSGVRDLNVGRVVLSGAGAALKGLDAYLEQNLNVRVQRFVPEAGLDLSGLSSDELDTFEADPSAFCVALGLARMSEDDDAFVIDLVPTEVKGKRRLLQRTLYLALGAVAAVAFLAFLWSDLSTKKEEAARDQRIQSRARRRADQTRRRYEEMVRERESVTDRIDALAWESRHGTHLMRAQRAVQDAAPRSIWVSKIEVGTRAAYAPDQADRSKKAAVEKSIVEVTGRIWGGGKKVGQTFNDFIAALRSHETKPHVSVVDNPANEGDGFELQLDFIGWATAEPDEEEGS